VLLHEGGLLADPVSASPGAAAVRQQSTINKDMPAQPDAELQTRAGIFEEHEAQRLRSSWAEIQGDFVDDPRRAVKEADALVADAMKSLAEVFANERRELEQQWDRGDNVTTEDLRLALRRYHAFFDRLLSV
jgi:ornithine carbamoyltransferase